jgi:hypothetical protein
MALFSSNRPLDRNKAWSCLTANLLVLPGLGSLLAKRKIGWFQIILAVLGAILTILGMITVALHWVATQQLPMGSGYYVWLTLGVVLFGAAWFWALITSLLILRQTKQPPIYTSSARR